MSNTTDTITQKINARADVELKREIEKEIENFSNYFRIGSPTEIEFRCGDTEMSINVWSMIDALKDKAFELHRADRQAKAVNKFMDDVERLGSEIDDLRNQLPQ